MAQFDYDLFTIGAGSGGVRASRVSASFGAKVAVAEERYLGGTCVNVGCIPTKTLVASARAAHVARRAAEFGVVVDGPVGVDMARVKARKDAIVRDSNEGVAG